MNTMDFFGMTPQELRTWVESIGLPAFRGQQIFERLYAAPIAKFSEMTVLPKELAERLDREFPLLPASETTRQESTDGTVKSLLELHDKKLIECVSIPTDDRHTVCISSQVGCAVGCTFCASGLNGVERDLSAGEIVHQVVHHHHRRPVTNVVFMGSGEPLFNYDNVIKAIRILAEPRGLGMGRRRFTLSTSGVPKRIVQLGDDEPQITLALSLHAADDETRSKIVPLNRRWPLEELLAAMDGYSTKVNRRMSLEYVLLADSNMTDAHADRLAEVAARYHAHVNLIPYNPVMDTPHLRPSSKQTTSFAERVAASGTNLTIRGQRGADIDAACGQLRLKAKKAEVTDLPA
jgi:23S rRNA (adenine2503-C2)-methyltransferase